MSIISELAAETSAAIHDPRGLEWRVRRIRPSAALQAGVGLPGIGSIAQPASEGEGQPVNMTPAAVAGRVEYLERVAMASVDGVRRAGSETWDRVSLVLPAQEDIGRMRLSVSTLTPEVLAKVGTYALSGAMEAADTVASFRGEE